MKFGVKLVICVMAIMVLIGSMMTPAYADYKPTTSFKDRFTVRMEQYLEEEGIEEYLTIRSIEEIAPDTYFVIMDMTEAGLFSGELAIDEYDDDVEPLSGVFYFMVFPSMEYQVSCVCRFSDGSVLTCTGDGDDIWDIF